MNSDLSLIPDQIVTYLRAFPDLAPLTRVDTTTDPQNPTTYYAIVGMNREDLLSQLQAAMNRLAVSVTVLVEDAIPDASVKSADVIYDPVNILIEVAEMVELNKSTPESNPPGIGTGMEAWDIADRVMAALKYWSIAGLAKPYRVEPRAQGVQNTTTQDDAKQGMKVVRLHLQTKAQGVTRAA